MRTAPIDAKKLRRVEGLLLIVDAEPRDTTRTRSTNKEGFPGKDHQGDDLLAELRIRFLAGCSSPQSSVWKYLLMSHARTRQRCCAFVTNMIDEGGKELEQYGSAPRREWPLHYCELTAYRAEEDVTIVQGCNFRFRNLFRGRSGKMINFEIEKSNSPNWDDTKQKRPFTLAGHER